MAASIILARLLEAEVFGRFAFVASTVGLTTALPEFGFAAAFMHRTGGQNDMNEEIKRVYFSLKLLFSVVWVLLMSAGVLLFAPPGNRWIFWFLVGATFVSQLMSIFNVILMRLVQFRRLAIAQIATALITAIVSIFLAWHGWGLWALLCGKPIAVIVEILVLGVIKPVWRPRLGWSKELAGYFISYGSKVFGSGLLLQALDRVDDIWTGAYLGDRALGFYDKAYSFATYPRALLAMPLTQVVAGTYSQLRDDRQRLSQVFSWINFLLIRANFAIAALLWLIAPQFIQLALGSKWLPMLEAFRLMLIYTLFDPVKGMIASLLTISGAASRVIRARIIQLAVMLIGLSLLGPRLGIAGVALAVDVMLVVGISILYFEARHFVDFSLRQFFIIPTAALILGFAGAQYALAWSKLEWAVWQTGLMKIVVFLLIYAGTLAAVEGKKILLIMKTLLNTMRKNKGEEF